MGKSTGFSVLAVGKFVTLRKDFAASRGFQRGQVVELLDDEDTAKRFGGRYRIRPVGAPPEVSHVLPRMAFNPLSDKQVAQGLKTEAKKKAQARR